MYYFYVSLSDRRKKSNNEHRVMREKKPKNRFSCRFKNFLVYRRRCVYVFAKTRVTLLIAHASQHFAVK